MIGIVPSCPVQSTLRTLSRLTASFGGERFQRATKKKVPPSMKEIIAEFSPHKGYTVSIRVVVPAARRVTGMFKVFC